MQRQELIRLIQLKKAPVILDVRSGIEFRNGHIPGAIHAPAMKILLRLAKLPTDKSGELVVTCEHGPRAQLASSILNLIGYRHVTLLEGHMAAWRRERLPVET